MPSGQAPRSPHVASRLVLVAALALLCVGGGVALLPRRPGTRPAGHDRRARGDRRRACRPRRVGRLASARRFGALEASVEQDGRAFPLFSLDAPRRGARSTQETPDRIRVTQAEPRRGSLTGLQDGPARLVVTAVAARAVRPPARRDGRRRATSPVRLTPPTLAVVSTHHYVNLGGAEMVVYRVTPARRGVGRAGRRPLLPGLPAPAGVAGRARRVDPALHVAFFALLFDQDLTTPDPPGRRSDAAGNAATRRVRPPGVPGDVRHGAACRSTTRSSRGSCRRSSRPRPT